MTSMQTKAAWTLPDPASQVVLCNGRIHSLTNVNCLARHPLSQSSGWRTKLAFAFASGTSSRVYHLVVRNEMETLCGLKVSRLKSKQALHLVPEVSPRTICKHCERIHQTIESQQSS